MLDTDFRDLYGAAFCSLSPESQTAMARIAGLPDRQKLDILLAMALALTERMTRDKPGEARFWPYGRNEVPA